MSFHRDTPNTILISGIPGTGKTCFGNELAKHQGFVHCNLEESDNLARLASNPSGFIDKLRSAKKVVVTWGFLPVPEQIAIVLQFKAKGFALIWLDGNRPAALRAFIERKTVSQELFYLQMYRIEHSQVIRQIQPIILDPFDQKGGFKTPDTLLGEINQLTS